MSSILHILGFDSSNLDCSVLHSTLGSSAALVTSSRLYEKLSESAGEVQLPPLIPIVPLAEALFQIQQSLKTGHVTVLASGDPLFFGIGRRLIEAFPDVEIHIAPALSSMQLAFSRFQLPWDDARFVSLHGRSNRQLAANLLVWPKVFVFTDSENSPNAIARQLLIECGDEATAGVLIHVGENLGFAEERLISGTLQEIAVQSFADPNVMILVNDGFSSGAECSFGLQEREICHSRGLITKSEVRAAALHALRLPKEGILWDVGAGSGSVGLEAARLFPGLSVLAIEKEEEQWANIERNRKHFAAWNLELVKGSAPEALQNLENPARVFVGGSGGNLEQILDYCVARLLPGGTIVVNAVIEKTAVKAPQILYGHGLDVEIKEIHVQRRSYPAKEAMSYNPITIIVGVKKVESGDK